MSDASHFQASGTAKVHGTRRWILGAPKSKQTTKAGTNDTFNPVIVRIFSTSWCWLGAKCWPRCWCYSGCWYLIISSRCLHPVSIAVSLSRCSPFVASTRLRLGLHCSILLLHLHPHSFPSPSTEPHHPSHRAPFAFAPAQFPKAKAQSIQGPVDIHLQASRPPGTPSAPSVYHGRGNQPALLVQVSAGQCRPGQGRIASSFVHTALGVATCSTYAVQPTRPCPSSVVFAQIHYTYKSVKGCCQCITVFRARYPPVPDTYRRPLSLYDIRPLTATRLYSAPPAGYLPSYVLPLVRLSLSLRAHADYLVPILGSWDNHSNALGTLKHPWTPWTPLDTPWVILGGCRSYLLPQSVLSRRVPLSLGSPTFAAINHPCCRPVPVPACHLRSKSNANAPNAKVHASVPFCALGGRSDF